MIAMKDPDPKPGPSDVQRAEQREAMVKGLKTHQQIKPLADKPIDLEGPPMQKMLSKKAPASERPTGFKAFVTPRRVKGRR